MAKRAAMVKKAGVSRVTAKKVTPSKVQAQKAQMAKKALLARKALLAKKVRLVAGKKRKVKQTFFYFVVLAVNFNNRPKSTTDFTATLTRGSQTYNATFDDTGVAVFYDIRTLTNFSYVLRINNEDNEQVFQGTVPANREFYIAQF
ncbi:hypothetical protein [Paenibacillus typhae]|uniref:hypothetical protein n=1 Tax=Paenibacillus typhae TaxID=1174501 RepID=UPI0011137533|nr:hypothetical protein [Paenibacillus typhae]MBY0008900.1 hypothetical protein [Paenibacillus typhae]